jgi:LysR family transcriptional regulator, transcription activator of glutamate synthase operon
MEMDYLCEFALVAKLGSFSLAAEELYISQSSLSKHIMALEKELNIQLFNRSHKVDLTEAGRQFLPYANQIAEIRKRLLNIASAQNDQNKNILKITSIPVMAIYDITGAVTRFLKEYPEINLTISECERPEIIRLLESGECELAFTRKSREEARILEYSTFYKDYLVAVLPRSHPLSAEKAINLKQLENEFFLFLDKETALYSLCFDLCTGAGFTPKIRYTGHRPENIIDLVSQGMGNALLMKHHTDYFKNTGVSYVDIMPTVKSAICLAKIKNRRLSVAGKIFWNYINSLHNV